VKNAWMSGALAHGASSARPVPMTPREREVLELLARGRANKEIANSLTCSVRTVEFHISNLLRKVGVSSRLELITHARHGTQSSVIGSSCEAPLIEVKSFAGVTATTLGDTLLTMWIAPATLERWLWSATLLDELAQSHPEGVRCLTLVLPGSDPPDRAVRSQIKADLTRLDRRLRRFVGVALGDSLRIRLVHAIMRAEFLLSGQSARLAVTTSVEQGFTYLLEDGGPSAPARDQLRLAVGELRRLLGIFGSIDDMNVPDIGTSS
jgi:DNA-binding CsgD family transcriptional regulator